MRQINVNNFRVWHKGEQKMCNIRVMTDEGCFVLGVRPGVDQHSDDGKLIIRAPHEGRFCFFQEIEVMEKTGLLDKNGKEIYEGDIVNNDGLIMEIKFVLASFCQSNEKGNWIMHSHDKSEVIGNIFENPDLL